MNPTTYASLEAYLAHWRALRRDCAAPADAASLLEEMNRTIREVLGPDAALLEDEPSGAAARRHRDRADTRRRRALLARGVLAG